MVSVDMVVQAAMVVGGIGSSGGWGQGGREGRQAGGVAETDLVLKAHHGQHIADIGEWIAT